MSMAMLFFNRQGTVQCVETIGERIKALREKRELTQAQLGQMVGIDQSTLSLIEKGRSADMMGMTLAKLCQELHWLVRGLDADGTKRKRNEASEELYMQRLMPADSPERARPASAPR